MNPGQVPIDPIDTGDGVPRANAARSAAADALRRVGPGTTA